MHGALRHHDRGRPHRAVQHDARRTRRRAARRRDWETRARASLVPVCVLTRTSGEVDDALARVVAAVGELERRLETAVCRQLEAPCLHVAPQRDALAVGNAEDHVHRIGLRDGSEQHVGTRYERAFGDRGAARHARNRRLDPRPVEIQLRFGHAGAGALHVSASATCSAEAASSSSFWLTAFASSTGRSRATSRFACASCASATARSRLGAGERGLERRRVDGEQRLALLDGSALVVVALQQYAGHARAHLDLAVARGLRRVLVGDRYVLRLDRDDRDDRGRESARRAGRRRACSRRRAERERRGAVSGARVSWRNPGGREEVAAPCGCSEPRSYIQSCMYVKAEA